MFFLFFMKELTSAILSQNHRRSQEGGPCGPGPPQLKCYQRQKFDKKSLVFSFLASFRIFAYNSTHAQQELTINNIDDQGPGAPP